MSRPCDILDLTHWTLTGPVDARTIIPAVTLVSNRFEDSRFFFTRSFGDFNAVVFKTPKTGSTTANSTKPRSELREQMFPPSNDRNWPLAGTHVLNATCAVFAVKDKDYVAQGHGKRNNIPFFKLAYVAKDKGLVLDVRQSPNGSDDHYKLCSMALKKFFTYEVIIQDGVLTVAVGSKSKTVDLVKRGFKLNDPDWYFKAGCYGPSGEVAFSELERSHS